METPEQPAQPPPSFSDSSRRAYAWLVEDIHVKGIFFLGVLAVGYHYWQANDLLTFGMLCGFGAGVAGVTKAKP